MSPNSVDKIVSLSKTGHISSRILSYVGGVQTSQKVILICKKERKMNYEYEKIPKMKLVKFRYLQCR